MSITYSINSTETLAYVTFPEEIDLMAALEVMNTLAADERLEPGFGILVDLQVAKPIPTQAEARMIITMALQRHLFLSHPTALVVSRVVQYEIGSMIFILAGLEGAAIQTFYNFEEAKQWLKCAPTEWSELVQKG